MALPENIQKLVDKVERGEELTRDEELTYFTEVMGYSKEEALHLFAIVENEDPNTIVD